MKTLIRVDMKPQMESMARRTRREFLGISAAFAGGMAIDARTAWSNNPDVIVVGAGAAGLAAARALGRRGYAVTVIEAKNRIGGRAWTDQETFGVAFDQGCAWLSNGTINPLIPIAEEKGFRLIDHTDPPFIGFYGDRMMSGDDWAELDRAVAKLEGALSRCGASRTDVSASSVAPTTNPWSPVANFLLGPADMSADLPDFSCLDWYFTAAPEPKYLLREGLGTLIEVYGARVPVRLNTHATVIDWSGQGVRVETNDGTLRARSCLVTVSNGVLASGRIRFTPEMPVAKREALDGVPMGLLTKIALEFDGARFGLSENGWLTYFDATRETAAFLSWPLGTNLLVGFVGGRFAWELAQAGEASAIDFALAELRALLGRQIDRHFKKGTVTKWGNDPWVGGAYSVARPGRFHQRATLAEPLGNRVFFAGEAVAGPLRATCGGAFKSGLDAADQISTSIR